MWYAQHRKKRVLPVKVVDYFTGWQEDITIMTLLSREYDLRWTEEPTLIFCSPFGSEHRQYDCAKIFCTGESWGFDQTDYDLSISFEYVESETAIRFPLYGYYFPDTALCKNIGKEDAKKILMKKSKFCTFVSSNGGPQERIEFMKRLSEYKQVDCCGSVMNNTGVQVEGSHSSLEQITFFADYKFTITFENTVKTGYTTEKIAAPMAAYSIPIYYGNPEIHRDFNPKSFVNVHEYASFEEAIEHIVELDQNDDLYLQAMQEPWFHGNTPTPYVDTHFLISRLARWIEKHRLSLDPDEFFQ